MRGIGHELSHPSLRRLTRGQRLFDVVEHVVERLAYLADFGGRIGIRRWYAYGEGDFAAIQLQLGDLLSSRGYSTQRTQAADDERAGHGRGARGEQQRRQGMYGAH